MPVVETGDVRLHWDARGSGSPILLIMGATYSSAMWWPVVDTLAGQHQVISFDNRGTGGSSCTKVASIEDMAADALAVLDAARVDRAHVYGVSLGGVVAQQFALAYPDRVESLVLGCTGILTADKPRAPKWLQLLFILPRRVRLAMGGKGYGPACPPERIERDRAVLGAERTDRIGLVAQQEALRAYSVSTEQIAGLTMPALVLHGTADGVVPFAWGQELAQTLPESRFVSYEGAGHNYLVAAGDRANADVLEFLADVDARAARR